MSIGLVWHVWEGHRPFSFTNSRAVHDSLDSELKESVSNHWRLWSREVNEPFWEARDNGSSVSCCKFGSEESWHILEHSLNCILDQISHWSLEEDLEPASELSPDVSMDVDVEVLSIDIDHNVDSFKSWHNCAIGKSFCSENESKSEVDVIEVYFDAASCHENPFLGSEA